MGPIFYNFPTFFKKISVVIFFSAGFMQSQLSKFIPANTLVGLDWSINIYKSYPLPSPTATILDCLIYCYNIEMENCEFFVFENATCFLGNTNLTFGNVTQAKSDVTLYLNPGKTILLGGKTFYLLYSCFYSINVTIG